MLGKPSPEFFTAPMDALGRGPDTALVVGDDLAAVVGGAGPWGAATVLVRSGKVDSVAHLPRLLRG